MKPGSLILVHLIDDVAENYTFKRSRMGWPLHVTIIPWFLLTKQKSTETIESISNYIAELQSFEILTGKEEFFGPDKKTRVTVIKTKDIFEKIHKQLLTIIESHDGLLAVSHPWVREQYRPHVTWHGERGIVSNSKLLIANIALVEIENEEMCKIIKIWQLKDKI